MEPQRNLKEMNNSGPVYVHAEAVMAQPSAPDNNEHMMAMMSQIQAQAAADRQAAAADRQAAAEERRVFEQNQRARQQSAVQTQQPTMNRNPKTQTTVVHVQEQGIDHCQHFACCIFFCGLWAPLWFIACVVPGFCPNPCCCCRRETKTITITKS